jgi:hypothetical protein
MEMTMGYPTFDWMAVTTPLADAASREERGMRRAFVAGRYHGTIKMRGAARRIERKRALARAYQEIEKRAAEEEWRIGVTAQVAEELAALADSGFAEKMAKTRAESAASPLELVQEWDELFINGKMRPTQIVYMAPKNSAPAQDSAS